MKFRKLHPWDLNPQEAVNLQNHLRNQTLLEPMERAPRLVAGADISYERFSDLAFAAFVVMDLSTLKIIDTATASALMRFPYIPGLLTFREGPALLEAWRKLKTPPDAVIFDGQGIAHPRRLGIAAHMGLLIDLPSLGCGKTRLVGSYDEPGNHPGDWSPLTHHGECIGAVLRTRRDTHPVFISPGHRMDLNGSLSIVMASLGKYRLPEPVRQAHLLANQLRLRSRLAA